MKKNGKKQKIQKRIIGLILLLLIFLLFSCTPPEIDTSIYYVATNGLDSNPGTIDQPWKTIQKAADSLVAGATVYIRGGIYEEQIKPKNSGISGYYITYAAYQDEQVTIDGQNIALSDWGGLFYVYGKKYIKITGLRVINAGPDNDIAGILVEKSSYITIEKNYTYNTKSSGIGVWRCSNIIVAENEVELANNDGSQENITIASTSNFEVKDNHIHDGGPGTNGGEGIDAKHSNNGRIYRNHVHNLNRVGIYIDAWDTHTYNIDVFQNIVHDVIADGFALSSEMGGLLENIRLFNNLSYKNDYGINITTYGDSLSHPMQNILIFNNTIANNGLGSWGGGVLVDNPDIENLIIANNIVSDNLSFQIVVYPHVPSNQVLVDFNLIYGFRGIEEGETKGTNYVEGNPLFIEVNSANYHLNSSSPAINAGSNSYLSSDVTKDLDGNPRLVGGKVDIGVYEKQ